MGRKKLYLWAAFFIVLISVEATFVRAQSDGKGNGNNGDGNGNGNNGDGNGSGNSGNGNGSGNNGNGNGSGNNSQGNGSGNNGNGNGNGNNGNGNGSGNNGNGNGNGNSGNDNGNGSGNGNGIGSGNNGNGSGSGNGNGSSSGNGNGNNGNDNGNGNGNNGNGNGNGNNGNGNGNGNNGNGNGNGNNGNGNGNGNNGNGNGNGNNGDGNGNGNGNNNYDATKDYVELTPLGGGQERALCKAEGDCNYKILTCPSLCPQKKPKKNKKDKGCYVDCGSKCEATCKYRKPNCNGYGSLCYDPRFVGGDGVMFYFHGTKGGNFAIVSDHEFQINAHFIGTRPEGRTRDFTWVQALSIMFETHTLVIAAKRVSHWDNNVDALIVMWDGKAVKIPTDGEAEWRTNGEDRQVVVERTDDNNNVRVKVAGLVELYINIRAIGKEENKVHNYRLPDDDAFAHLETQFKFSNLSHLVEGVLGKTYRPDYVTSVKIGVPMPMMGGEDKYQTPSLYSTLCKACRFQRPSGLFANSNGVAQY